MTFQGNEGPHLDGAHPKVEVPPVLPLEAHTGSLAGAQADPVQGTPFDPDAADYVEHPPGHGLREAAKARLGEEHGPDPFLAFPWLELPDQGRHGRGLVRGGDRRQSHRFFRPPEGFPLDAIHAGDAAESGATYADEPFALDVGLEFEPKGVLRADPPETHGIGEKPHVVGRQSHGEAVPSTVVVGRRDRMGAAGQQEQRERVPHGGPPRDAGPCRDARALTGVPPAASRTAARRPLRTLFRELATDRRRGGGPRGTVSKGEAEPIMRIHPTHAKRPGSPLVDRPPLPRRWSLTRVHGPPRPTPPP